MSLPSCDGLVRLLRLEIDLEFLPKKAGTTLPPEIGEPLAAPGVVRQLEAATPFGTGDVGSL